LPSRRVGQRKAQHPFIFFAMQSIDLTGQILFVDCGFSII